MRVEKGLNTANIPFDEDFGHSAPTDFIRLTVDGGGRRDHIATIRKEIDALSFLAGEVQMWRQFKVKVRKLAGGRADGMGFEQIGIIRFESVKNGFRVKVEDDELADATGDYA